MISNLPAGPAALGDAQQQLSEPAFDPLAPLPQGVTLAEFVGRLRADGLQCDLSATGTEAWVPGARGAMLRLPLECTADVDGAVLRGLLQRRGIWVVSYQCEGRDSHPANCFSYVCRDSNYALEALSRNGRRDVRRGQRHFNVRRCTWAELAHHGFAAEADTAARHGYPIPARAEFEHGVNGQRDTAEIWGSWNGDELAAWTSVVRIDDWAMINVARSCTAALKMCPNNALLYAATRQLLVDEKRRYVTHGLSSIQHDGRELSTHRYKVRMGYQAVPLHRRFVLHPLLRGLVGSRLVSWGCDQLVGVFPESGDLRRLAGMARLLSGRDQSPLRWSEEPHDDA